MREQQSEVTHRFTNTEIAACFDEIAELLDAQHANEFRVRAYRQAANMLRALARSVQEIWLQAGLDGLCALPTIGVSLAQSIEQLTTRGQIELLQRLRGETTPASILATVPTIGPVLASRIHKQLQISTLLELQSAAYDGRLAAVPGFGEGRLRAVRESLAGRFHQAGRRAEPVAISTPETPSASGTFVADEPSVAELLDVDREYRTKAEAERLPKIAPRRFNPTGEAWLPILHTTRNQTHYTALFSNTVRAHELGTTKDWVVIYRDDHDGAGQWTVVTAYFGALKGKRIVRGREAECADYYQSGTTQPSGFDTHETPLPVAFLT